MTNTGELTVLLPAGLMEALGGLPEHDLLDQAGPCWLVRIAPDHLVVVGPDADIYDRDDSDGPDPVDAMIAKWCWQPGWNDRPGYIGDTAIIHLYYKPVRMQRLL